MSNMLKKSMGLCMMEKPSLCVLPYTPVSSRALRACASVVRVRENWRREKVRHTHHEKHVGAVAAQQVVQLRSEHQQKLVLVEKIAVRDEVVDRGHVGGRGIA